MLQICFVCLGNICRSPTAEGVMRHLLLAEDLATQIQVDSAGTAAYHAGERPDPRSTAAAQRRGIDLRGRARPFLPEDWGQFQFVVAMATDNFAELKRRAPTPDALARLSLFRDFVPGGPKGLSTPDPYYGGASGFEEVLDICDDGCRGLLGHIRSVQGLLEPPGSQR